MIVLDQHRVGERLAVVEPPTRADGSLLQRAKPRKRLAGIADTSASARGAHVPTRVRRDARAVLEKVQRAPLARQDRPQRPADSTETLPLAYLLAVGHRPGHVDTWIKLSEHLGGYRSPREDAVAPGHEAARANGFVVDDRDRREVAQ